jgi:hypothetical protein
VLLLELDGGAWGMTLTSSTYILHNFMIRHVLQYGRQGVLLAMLLKLLSID